MKRSLRFKKLFNHFVMLIENEFYSSKKLSEDDFIRAILLNIEFYYRKEHINEI